jgi:hypothetical protein
MKQSWYSNIGAEKIEVTECLDSGSQRVWIKFEPVDKSKLMEVCNHGKSNYYGASSAGSLLVAPGTTEISKDSGSKVIVFPLDRGVSLDVYKYTLLGDRFLIAANKPTWVGYVVSGSGSISPT